MKNTTKNEYITLAVTLTLTGIFAGTAAYLLSRAHPAINADSLIGFGAVLALLAMAALEYRFSWKKLIGR